MSLPKSVSAYEAEASAFDKALDDKSGIRIGFPTEGQARQFRYRLHYFRSLVREQNKDLYEKGNPLWATSPYDTLICRIRDDTAGEWWVYIEKNEVIPGHVESLSG